jgi:hypothetical protein
MPAGTKRTREEVIDLTADSSDVERDEPSRKNARLAVTVNRPQQSTRDTWVQDDDDDDGDDDKFDIIDLSQEVDNSGVGFVEVGRIRIFYCSVPSVALLTCLR